MISCLIIGNEKQINRKKRKELAVKVRWGKTRSLRAITLGGSDRHR